MPPVMAATVPAELRAVFDRFYIQVRGDLEVMRYRKTGRRELARRKAG
jgi:hypothetical protein